MSEQLRRIGELDKSYRAGEVGVIAAHTQYQLELASLYQEAQAAEEAGQRRKAIDLYHQVVSRDKDDGYGDANERLRRLLEEEDLDKLGSRADRLGRTTQAQEFVQFNFIQTCLNISRPKSMRRECHASGLIFTTP